MFLLLIASPLWAQQHHHWDGIIEYGANLHSGDNTPLWQVSNRQGLGSIDNSTYLRASVKDTYRKHNWVLTGMLDMVAAAGMTADVFIQQAYLNMSYKWFNLFVGSREKSSPLLSDLSSGDMTWSGNARPIPQVSIGTAGYRKLSEWIYIKGDLSYGWFTDGHYQERTAMIKERNERFYVKGIKYHHKEGYVRIQKPGSRWQFDLGMTLDTEFGGYQIGRDNADDLGNSFKDYLRVFFPGAGDEDGPANELYYQGNYVGSEHIWVTYQFAKFDLSVYLNNHFDDLSGMGKMNAMDGLWGIQYRANDRRTMLYDVVLEYLQTTDQSNRTHHQIGPDNYYNNGVYPGWSHWGLTIGNPLIASPIYNKNGNLTFRYNRVKALHLAIRGKVSRRAEYTVKLTGSRTWGTYHNPLPKALDNFSAYMGVEYYMGKGWFLETSLAMDRGDIYGDNQGWQLMLRKLL